MATPDPVADILSKLHSRQSQYREAYKYYTGKQAEKFLSSRIATALSEQGKSFKFNFVAAAVDAVLERCEIAGRICPDEEAREFLDQVWRDNEMSIEAKTLIKDALLYGDSYAIAMPDDDTDMFPSGLSIYSHLPYDVFVEYDPARPRVKSRAVHSVVVSPTEENGLKGSYNDRYLLVTVYYPDRIEEYYSRYPLAKGAGTIDLRRVDLALANEYAPPVPGLIPIFHFRTDRPYGSSVMENGYGPQDALYKLILSMLSGVDFAAFPQRYALTEAALPGPVDNLSLASAPDENTDEIDPADFVSGPGTTWVLRGTKDVGQFNPADTDNFIKPIDAVLGYASRIMSVPSHYFSNSATPMSGYAYRQAERPLTKKTEHLQQLFESAFSDMFDYCLWAKGFNVPRGESRIAWTPMETVDKEMVETAILKQQAGVPEKVTLIELGYQQEEVDTWEEDLIVEQTADPIALNTEDETQ